MPKADLLVLYTTGKQPESHTTDFPTCSTNVDFEGQQIELHLWDTAGQEDYKKLRPLSYPQTDVFVLCFSLTSPTSLENISTQWVPELEENCPGTPRILVGLNSDMRETVAGDPDAWKAKGMEPMPLSEGEKVKSAIGPKAYVECSVKTETNVKKVFEEAIRSALAGKVKIVTSDAATEGGCCEVVYIPVRFQSSLVMSAVGGIVFRLRRENEMRSAATTR
jgi:Ras-related C3 botulinum toxin substrate 1